MRTVDTDNIRFVEGGVISAREFSEPSGDVKICDSVNAEYFKDGKILCWMGRGQDAGNATLICVDEATLTVEKLTDIPGTNAIYVSDGKVLFGYDDGLARLIDIHSYEVVRDAISTLSAVSAHYKFGQDRLLVRGIQSFALYSWPEFDCLWVYKTNEVNCNLLVLDESVYFIHKSGVVALDLNFGDVLWELTSASWQDKILYKGKPPKDTPKIRMEVTGIYNNILVLSFDGGGMAGLNIKTQELAWVLDTVKAGRVQLRITQDGIGWFKTGYTSIQRLDVAKGVLLPEMHFQFAPVLTSDSAPRVGAFDISNTHLIADASVPTEDGKQGYIIGINRETGVVDWAVPIPVQGMLTKLFVLNNRVYATGTTIDLDTNEVRSKMFVIEGEGGFRLD